MEEASLFSWSWIENSADEQIFDKIKRDPASIGQLEIKGADTEQAGRLINILTKIPSHTDAKIQAQFDEQIGKLFVSLEKCGLVKKRCFSKHEDWPLSFLFQKCLALSELERDFKQAVQNDQPELACQILSCLDRLPNLKGPNKQSLMEWALLREAPQLGALILEKGKLPEAEVYAAIHLALHFDKIEALEDGLFLKSLFTHYANPIQLMILALLTDRELPDAILDKIEEDPENTGKQLIALLKCSPGMQIKVLQKLKNLPESILAIVLDKYLIDLTQMAVQHAQAFKAFKHLMPQEKLAAVIRDPENAILYLVRDGETLEAIVDELDRADFIKLLASPMPQKIQAEVNREYFGFEQVLAPIIDWEIRGAAHGLEWMLGAWFLRAAGNVILPAGFNDMFQLGIGVPYYIAGTVFALSWRALALTLIARGGVNALRKNKKRILETTPFELLFLSLKLNSNDAKPVSFADRLMKKLSATEFMSLMDNMPINPFLGSFERDFLQLELSKKDFSANIQLLKKHYTDEEVAAILARKPQDLVNLCNNKEYIAVIKESLGVKAFNAIFLPKLFDIILKEKLELKFTPKFLYDFFLEHLGERKFKNLVKSYFELENIDTSFKFGLFEELAGLFPASVVKRFFTGKSNPIVKEYLQRPSTKFFGFVAELTPAERLDFIVKYDVMFHILDNGPKLLSAPPSLLYGFFAGFLQPDDWGTVLGKEVAGKNICSVASPYILEEFKLKLSPEEVEELLAKHSYKYALETLLEGIQNGTVEKLPQEKITRLLGQEHEGKTLFYELLELYSFKEAKAAPKDKEKINKLLAPANIEKLFGLAEKYLSVEKFKEIVFKENSEGHNLIEHAFSVGYGKFLKKLKLYYPEIIEEVISVHNKNLLPLLKDWNAFKLAVKLNLSFWHLFPFFDKGALRQEFAFEEIKSLSSTLESQPPKLSIRDYPTYLSLKRFYPRFLQWIKHNFPNLEKAGGKEIAAKIKENLAAFTEKAGKESLAAGFILADDELLFNLTQILGQAKAEEQLNNLCRQLPIAAHLFREKLELIAFKLDERHMASERVKQVNNVDPELLKPFNYKEISQRFARINFTDPKQLGYRDPRKLKNDVGVNQYEPVSVTTLRTSLDTLIYKYIPNNTPTAGTPSASSPELPIYYENLKKSYQEILYHISELEKLPAGNPREQQDVKDQISRNLIELAVSSLHCGSRWISQANESNSDLKGEPESLELMLDKLFVGMRTLLAEKIGSALGPDSHTVNSVMNLLSPKVGLPAGKIIETFGFLANIFINEEEVLKRFYKLYTPGEMLAYLKEHIDQKPRLKEVVLEWFRDNPGEFRKEHYDQLKADFKDDKRFKELLQTVPNTEINMEELKEFAAAIKTHQPSESLPERLAKLEKVKPDEYALELVGILRQEFRGVFSPASLRLTASILTEDKNLQTIFHDYLACRAKPNNEFSMAINKLICMLQKVDQANNLVAYIKEKGVALDQETVRRMIDKEREAALDQETEKRMIDRATPFTLLEGVIDKCRGNEFVDTIYTSLGVKLIEAMPDLIENEAFAEQITLAITPEQQLVVLQTVWQLIFNGRYTDELKSLLKAIKYEPGLLKQIMQALRQPDNENLESCKKALLEEPLMRYRFDNQQLIRLLVQQGFLQARTA